MPVFGLERTVAMKHARSHAVTRKPIATLALLLLAALTLASLSACAAPTAQLAATQSNLPGNGAGGNYFMHITDPDQLLAVY
jgi:hypothetical protein